MLFQFIFGSTIKMGYSRKKPNRAVKDTEFPGVVKQRASGKSRRQLKKKWNFPRYSTRTHVEFPWVLVFDLIISKECHTILSEFPVVKACLLRNF